MSTMQGAMDATEAASATLGEVSNLVGFVIELVITYVTGGGPVATLPRNPQNRNLLRSPRSDEATLSATAAQHATCVAQYATCVASQVQGCCDDLAALYRSLVVTRPAEHGAADEGWEFVDDDGSPRNQGRTRDAENETETVDDEESGVVVVSHYVPSDATAAFDKMMEQ